MGKLALNHGEQVVLLHVFHVYEVVVPIGPARVHSVICAEEDTCLHLPRCTGDGTEVLMLPKSGMPCAQLLQPLESQHWLWLKVIALKKFLKSHLLFRTRFNPTPRQRRHFVETHQGVQ